MSGATDLNVKYRPQTFDEVLGHTEIVKSVKQVLESGNSRQFILTGASGVGKTTLARIIAREFGVPTNANGEFSPSSLLEIDAAQRSKVEDMRSLHEFVNFSSIVGGNKCIILDECHALSAQAWNALLKNIEEPPSYFLWVLCTTNSAKIPKTIKTRCLEYKLGDVPQDKITELLKWIAGEESISVGDSVLAVCAQAAKGSVRDAITMMTQCNGVADVESAQKVCASFVSDHEPQVIELAKALIYGGDTNCYKLWRSLQEMYHPEEIGAAVFNYAGAIVAGEKTDDKTRMSAIHVMESFSESFHPSHQKYGVVLAISRALYAQGE